MTHRKPFITKRPVALDRKYGNGRTAEIGAGDQCVVLSVDSFTDENDREGAKVDLSFADEDAPLRVCVDLDHVLVPTHHFNHKVVKCQPLTAGACVKALADIHRAAIHPKLSQMNFSVAVIAALHKLGLNLSTKEEK